MALGGDGIGPKVVHAGVQVLEHTAAKVGLKLEIEDDLLHGAAYDAYGFFCRTKPSRRRARTLHVGSRPRSSTRSRPVS